VDEPSEVRTPLTTDLWITGGPDPYVVNVVALSVRDADGKPRGVSVVALSVRNVRETARE
jgi:hypothetical protein